MSKYTVQRWTSIYELCDQAQNTLRSLNLAINSYTCRASKFCLDDLHVFFSFFCCFLCRDGNHYFFFFFFKRNLIPLLGWPGCLGSSFISPLLCLYNSRIILCTSNTVMALSSSNQPCLFDWKG